MVSSSIVVTVLILIALILKFLFLDERVYCDLRRNHSKSYIKKHYRGFINRIFYRDYIKEISKINVIFNYSALLLILFLCVLLFASFFSSADLTLIITIVLIIYGAIALIGGAYDLYRFAFLRVDIIGRKLSKTDYSVGWILLAAAVIILLYLYFNR